MGMFGAILGQAASSIGGGIIQREFDRSAEKRSYGYANDMWQREFEASNTAHTREVKDLKEAGLNPILSAGGNGAGVPSGSPPTAQAPQIQMPEVINTFMQSEQLKQNQQKINIDKFKAINDANKSGSDIELNKAKQILLRKGMIRAELEGEASGVLQNIIKFMKESWKTNSPPQAPSSGGSLP